MRRRQFICLAVAALAAPAAKASETTMTVHKDPFCGCCEAWASAYEAAGYRVTIHDEADMDAVKTRLHVPASLQGCHTAIIDGYYLEGHVPLEAVGRLLRERPALAGLAVAGMPRGSLGMGQDPSASYEVMAVSRDGSAPYLFLAVKPR